MKRKSTEPHDAANSKRGRSDQHGKVHKGQESDNQESDNQESDNQEPDNNQSDNQSSNQSESRERAREEEQLLPGFNLVDDESHFRADQGFAELGLSAADSAGLGDFVGLLDPPPRIPSSSDALDDLRLTDKEKKMIFGEQKQQTSPKTPKIKPHKSKPQDQSPQEPSAKADKSFKVSRTRSIPKEPRKRHRRQQVQDDQHNQEDASDGVERVSFVRDLLHESLGVDSDDLILEQVRSPVAVG